MPGSGKSTLGKVLAGQLQIHFVDLDREIEKAAQKKIPLIFAEDGEDAFRKLEARLLQQWAESPGSFIMATGGGAPCFHQGIEIINKTGLSIFLDVPVQLLLERLKSKHDRPLLNSDVIEKEKQLLMIASVRMPCYRKAKVSIQDPTVDELLSIIHFQK